MSDYVFVKVNALYLSLQDDEETLDLVEKKEEATAFPAEVVPELKEAFEAQGLDASFEEEPISQEELALLMAADGETTF